MLFESATSIRHDWTSEEILSIYQQPLNDLLFHAQSLHRRYHNPNAVQRCTLLSVKTGGCPEDCAYCPQSSKHNTFVEPEKMLSLDEVLERAKAAKNAGASRFCMGAAWRDAKDGPAFDNVLSMVRGIRHLGMEACATLGMLTDAQAERLKEAGLTAYNHNLDTSRSHYRSIISTRTYDERLQTIARVQKAGIGVCCGGIIGMGETLQDRASMLATLAGLDPHPSSVPVNALVAVEGTPLEHQPPMDPIELVRMCATARIVMPKTMVRLSAGRETLSREAQALCFLAGANSIFYGDQLLTTGNPDTERDEALFKDLGLVPLEIALSDPHQIEPGHVAAAE